MCRAWSFPPLNVPDYGAVVTDPKPDALVRVIGRLEQQPCAGIGSSFRLYVEKVLLPTLRPGDIVVMDNLGSHRGKAVRQLIRSAGAKLFFLPKYSPDLNPIDLGALDVGGPLTSPPFGSLAAINFVKI